MSFFIFSSKPRLFVLSVIAAVFGIGAAGACASLYFTTTGDLLSEAAVAELQKTGGASCTYLSLATNNHAAYKFAAYENAFPRVVALGSSLVLELNSRMFSQPFYNLGRAMNNLSDGRAALRLMQRLGKPEIVLLGLDYWLFSPNHVPPPENAARPAVNRLDPAQVFKLLGAVWRNPELAADIFSLSAGLSCPIGMAAKAYHAGFGPDGFYYYGERMVLPPDRLEDYQFRDSLRRSRVGSRRFEHGDEPDPARIEDLVSLVRAFETQGVKVIAFAPPVAPPVAQQMAEGGKHGYIAKTWAALAARGVAVHDFHDPASLNLVACDFLDGFHAGDVAFARMLRALAAREPALRPYVKRSELDRLSGMSGRAAVYFQEEFGIPEPDFLGLGCIK